MAENTYTLIDPVRLKEKTVCLTIDIEQDFGELLEEPCFEAVQHIPELVQFFKERDIPLTCFIQGSIMDKYPGQIDELGRIDVELEAHSYNHGDPALCNPRLEVELSKEAYKRYTGKDPLGYRFPLGVIAESDYTILSDQGFRYDSSIFPSWRPGTFFNLRKPTMPYFVDNTRIIEFPFSVFSNFIRVPIAMSYIKLIGKPYLQMLKMYNLPKLVVFDFHLHDLFKLESVCRLPLDSYPLLYRNIFRRIYLNDKDGLDMLDSIISLLLKKGYAFKKLVDIYDEVAR